MMPAHPPTISDMILAVQQAITRRGLAAITAILLDVAREYPGMERAVLSAAVVRINEPWAESVPADMADAPLG